MARLAVRKDGIIELNEDEVIYLWQKKYRAKMPSNLSLKKAAEAVLLEYGAERIEIELKRAYENHRCSSNPS